MNQNEEYLPEYGSSHKPVARIPVLFIIQTSRNMRQIERVDPQGRMQSKIEQITDGLEIFIREMKEDYLTSVSVDVSVVTFGGDVEIPREFDTVENWSTPSLTARGHTPMCEAIISGIEHYEQYRAAIDAACFARKRAFVFLLTDGHPNHTAGKQWNRTRSVIKKGVADNHFFFQTVGLGEHANMDVLSELVSKAPADKVQMFQSDDGHHAETFETIVECVKLHRDDIS
jgi:uncharacterized protein YegL